MREGSVLVTLHVAAGYTCARHSVVAGLGASRIVRTGHIVADGHTCAVALAVFGVLHGVTASGGRGRALVVRGAADGVGVAHRRLVVASRDWAHRDSGSALATADVVADRSVAACTNTCSRLLGSSGALSLASLVRIHIVARVDSSAGFIAGNCPLTRRARDLDEFVRRREITVRVLCAGAEGIAEVVSGT